MKPTICGCCNVFTLGKVVTIIDIILTILVMLLTIVGLILYNWYVAIRSGYIGLIGFFIYVSLHLIFFSMELHGIRKKNICLNIFSCVIWCIIALEMLGNLLLLLIFSGVTEQYIEQYLDNLEITDGIDISELYRYSYRYVLLIFTKTFYVYTIRSRSA